MKHRLWCVLRFLGDYARRYVPRSPQGNVNEMTILNLLFGIHSLQLSLS